MDCGWLYFKNDKYKIRYAFLKKIVLNRLIKSLFNSKITIKTKIKMLLALMNVNVINFIYSKEIIVKMIERQK